MSPTDRTPAELLDDAERGLTEAIEALEAFGRATGQSDRLDAYIVGHLQGWRDGDGPGDSTAIPRLREGLDGGDR